MTEQLDQARRPEPAPRSSSVERAVRFVDRLTDPDRRFVRWISFGALLLGLAASIAWAVDALSTDPSGERTAAASQSDPVIPRIDGAVEHVTSEAVSLELQDHLDEGQVLELHLRADSERVDAISCEDNTLGACSVSWAADCALGTPEDVAADFSEMLSACPLVYSFRTVDEEFNEVTGWGWEHGSYTLSGYYAVEEIFLGQGTTEVTLREVPPEVARQL